MTPPPSLLPGDAITAICCCHPGRHGHYTGRRSKASFLPADPPPVYSYAPRKPRAQDIPRPQPCRKPQPIVWMPCSRYIAL